MSALICRLFGHRWKDTPIRYEQATTMAYGGNDPVAREVPVTWVCDETCGRCGRESWWPS